MNILLTNDDGIDSEGIQTPAKIFRERGHKVYVIAPDINRSGISHAVSMLNGPVKISAYGEDTWACSGYPVDCVIAGIMGALKPLMPGKPDLVLSGINRGGNIGTDIIYSGTAAAARQASITGVPAIALSLEGDEEYYWEMAALWSADHLEELISYWEQNIFVNVNIPNSPHGPVGMALTRPAIKDYHDVLSVVDAPDGNRWCSLKGGQETAGAEPDNDFNTVARNFVSISRLHCYALALEKKQDKV